jgi:alpha-tubulin suppressor-like RCC1 family protein
MSLSGGQGGTLALDAEGRVWEWGWDQSLPTMVDLKPLGGAGVVSMAAGTNLYGEAFIFVLDDEGRLWGRGRFFYWNTSDLQQVDLTALGGAEVVRMVVGVGDHVMILDDTGQLWGWGSNSRGQLGDGTTTNAATLVAVDQSGLRGWSAIDVAIGGATSYALDDLGRVWVWGSNENVGLGDGSTREEVEWRSLPGLVQLPEDTRISAIASSGGDFALALDETGQLWSWGRNMFGQLGDGTEEMRPVPVKVDQSALGDATIISMAAGLRHTLALDSLGRLWAWGNGCCGVLGTRDSRESRSTPVRVDDSALGDDPWVP